MSIRKLLLETEIILVIMTSLVITLNGLQIRNNAEKHFAKLQEEYFETTYQIYKDEIIGNLLLGDQRIQKSLFNEIAKNRGIGLSLTYQHHRIDTGIENNASPIKTYQIHVSDGKDALLSLYSTNGMKNPWIMNELVIPLILDILTLSFGFLFLWRRFSKSLLSPLSELVTALKTSKIETYQPKLKSIYEINNLSDTLKFMHVEIQKKALVDAEVAAAKQVGHDIRSPLACLILSLSQTSSIPEEQRTLMRSAIQRITDITNCLHSKAKQDETPSHQIESVMISSLMDTLISEKRVQVRNKKNIQIDLNLEKAYGLFATINSIEFKRVISNLINNSIESFDDKPHNIHVTVAKYQQWIQIDIDDNGKGIPTHILKNIGRPGFSYGKETDANAGTGLGLSHAYKIMETFTGSLAIHSEVDKGTRVTLRLPQGKIPEWFIERIDLSDIEQIVILDDDLSIYNLWCERFSRFVPKKINLIHFTCSNQFRAYHNQHLTSHQNQILFLFDFELLNQPKTGLDLIEELDLTQRAILVTSYHEDMVVVERCHRIGLGIIPKSMAAFIPFSS